MTACRLADEAAAAALGQRLARALRPGDVIGLSGPLGAGKSVLARAIVRSWLGAPDLEVPSPTYTLVQHYAPEDPGQPEIWHADLYRLDAPEELLETGLMDAFDDAVVLIEWPEKAGGLWPGHGMVLRLDLSENGARIAQAAGVWPDRLAGAFR
ncbi:MAG: tRNA (adenosine(37)-N6)-threonylcarbamoyltransferase complex ATPase subunit type 1 TsaE [Rhodothalassiaceae bacterium]